MLQGIGAVQQLMPGSERPEAATGAPGVGAAVETTFSDALSAAAARSVGKLENAQGLSLDAMSGGEIETREVVDAVMGAEQTLQAAIAIRDKIVTAYLDISRMPI